MLRTIKVVWHSDRWTVVIFFLAIAMAIIGIGFLPGTAIGFAMFFGGSLNAYMYFVLMRRLERTSKNQKPRQ